MTFNNKDKIGFTLAEILLTLLIVGVVTSLTIPAIINDIRNKDLEVQNNNLRSILLRTHRQIKTENGGTIDGLNYGVEMSKKLNLAKNCIVKPQASGCWHPAGVIKIRQVDGSYKVYSTSNYSYGLVLQNGIMLLLGSSILNCKDRTSINSNTMACYKSTHYYSGYCTQFLSDINGRNGPNIIGQDIRVIDVHDNGIFIYGDKEPARWYSERNYDTYTANAWLSGGTCYSPNIYTHTQY